MPPILVALFRWSSVLGVKLLLKAKPSPNELANAKIKTKYFFIMGVALK